MKNKRKLTTEQIKQFLDYVNKNVKDIFVEKFKEDYKNSPKFILK